MDFPRTVLLAGGVGGARMANGLARVLPAGYFSVIVNVGDDETFHGLRVCPDIDTVLYTLSGQINTKQAWGVEGDSQKALSVLKRLDAADTWMTLGDADLGLHLYRTQRLAAGLSLTEVTDSIRRAFAIEAQVLPITDEPLATRILTAGGQALRFQQWFVRERGLPQVKAISFDGEAKLSEAVGKALDEAQLLVFAPSNPWLSIAPMLVVDGLAARLKQSSAKKIAVSPLIGGKAVKGPLERLMHDLHCAEGNAGIADFYRDWVQALVIDTGDFRDCEDIRARGLQAVLEPTRIAEAGPSAKLARALLHWFDVNSVEGELNA